MEHPERVINMDAMNYGEHIGDIEGKYLGKNMINMHFCNIATFQILIVCEEEKLSYFSLPIHLHDHPRGTKSTLRSMKLG